MKELFNPLVYGFYSWILFSHKVLRRLVPIFLITLFISNLFLIDRHLIFTMSFYAQALAYLIAAGYIVLFNFKVKKKSPAAKLISAWTYFCIGNAGTLLGIVDFLAGRKYSKWDSVKK